jgi:hypothetical protein
MLRRSCCIALAAACAATSAHAGPPPGYALGLAVYRPATNHVYAYSDLATKAFALNGSFGVAGDVPVVGDFDGNGVSDLALFHAGTWSIDVNHDLGRDLSLNFGGAGDIPLAADFDGDGIADLVVYRNGTWFIRSSRNAQVSQRALGGSAADKPVIADFDGDGVPDLAVFRSGTWLIQTHSTTGADIIDHFGGLPDDAPCAADWDQDGRADLCIFRNGIWYFRSLGASAVLDAYAFGAAGDIPLPGGAFDSAAIYVKAGASGTQDGSAAHPFPTLAKAFDAAVDGSVIRVAGGNYTESLGLVGPAVNYAPGKFGKNNLKLLGVSRRAVNITPASGDAITLWGATGNVIEGFTIGSTTGRGVVLIGGAGSVNPSLPGSSVKLALNTIAQTYSYGVLVTGASQADIRHNQINSSKITSGIGTQGGAPSATIVDNELAFNGYTLASGANGNGIEAQSSSQLTIQGNRIHDNNRFGIIGVTDSHLTINGNALTANRLNGVILCGSSPGDTSTAQIVGNEISHNGVDVQNGQGYNGVEFFITCIGTQTVTGNVFDANSLNGIFIGAGTATIGNNSFSNNGNGITVYADSSSSANTLINVYGNTFGNNLRDGIFAQLATSSTRSVTATVGGTQAGQANTFFGQGYHGIGCAGSPIKLTCASGTNMFTNNADDIESVCPKTCVK